MARDKTKEFRDQARVQAFLQYNPQKRGLMALLREAEANLRGDVSAAHSMKRGLVQAAMAARPGVQQAYGDTMGRLGNAFGDFNSPSTGSIADNLAQVGGQSGSAIVAAALAEQAAAKGQVAQETQRQLADLTGLKVRAREGEAQQILQARSGFKKSQGDILGEIRALAQEKGVFQADALAKLLEAESDRRAELRKVRIQQAGATKRTRITQRQQNIRAGNASEDTYVQKFGMTKDEFMALPRAQRTKLIQKSGGSGGGSGGGDNGPTAGEISATRDFGDRFQKAIQTLRDDIDPDQKFTRAEARSALIQGLPEIPKKTKKVRDKDGILQTVVVEEGVPGTDAYGPLATRVALDMYYDGHLSRETIELLRKNGIRPARLPSVKFPGKWRSRPGDQEFSGRGS